MLAKTVPPSFDTLIRNVSEGVITGLSDNEIVYRYNTSIEFVRRQRKFLKPLPPVLPQQLKRGVFSMETVEKRTKNGKRYKSAAREKLQAWVEKDPDAHLELSIAEIVEQASVSMSTVRRYLADCVAACNGITADEVWAQRREAGFTQGVSRRNGGPPHSPETVEEKSETSVEEQEIPKKKPVSMDTFNFLGTLEAGLTEKSLEIWYLASPYSDSDPAVVEARVETVSKLTAKLINENPDVVVFSPIAYTHPLQKEHQADPGAGWYLWDLAMLRWCRKLIVARIDGWRESQGVRLEIAYAMGAGIPIEFVDAEQTE